MVKKEKMMIFNKSEMGNPQPSSFERKMKVQRLGTIPKRLLL
jgi:hypothetical protein